MADFATAGGHYYLPDGTPYYRIVGANGVERDVTLRDARKVGALPSVTGIIRMAAAPGLDRWKLRQLGLACLTLPRIPEETEDAFLERAEKDAQEQAKKAAERGTEIHGGIERYYRKEGVADDLAPFVDAAAAEIESVCGTQQWRPERSFACKEGYGGKLDLSSTQWIVDAKGKEGDVRKQKLVLYEDHYMQLAAYRRGALAGDERGGILFFGRDVPSAVLVEASQADLERGEEMFMALLTFWQAKNRYKP